MPIAASRSGSAVSSYPRLQKSCMARSSTSVSSKLLARPMAGSYASRPVVASPAAAGPRPGVVYARAAPERAGGPPMRAAAPCRKALAALAAVLAAAGSADARELAVRRVVTGLSRPVFLTAPPGDIDRVFIAEQHTGAIRVLRLEDRTLLPTPFLVVPDLATGPEQGLLGLAFHPGYAENGLFYVYATTAGSGSSRIVRYRVSDDPDLAEPASALPILGFAQPQANHNGGWIGFGPD